MLTSFRDDGFAIIPRVIETAECLLAAEQIATLTGSAGTRNLLSFSWCQELAAKISHHPDIAKLLRKDARPVLCTYFEKSTEMNWLVPAHQDLSIPVRERVSDPALHGWSVKEGQVFVQAPDETLAELFAVRVHIDRCGPEDGALRVVPGSHRNGRLPMAEIGVIRSLEGDVLCTAEAGDALVMRPLLIHASSKSRGDSTRRILHFLFGPAELPCGLEWPEFSARAGS